MCCGYRYLNIDIVYLLLSTDALINCTRSHILRLSFLILKTITIVWKISALKSIILCLLMNKLFAKVFTASQFPK